MGVFLYRKRKSRQGQYIGGDHITDTGVDRRPLPQQESAPDRAANATEVQISTLSACNQSPPTYREVVNNCSDENVPTYEDAMQMANFNKMP